jgi:hypothetical protein
MSSFILAPDSTAVWSGVTQVALRASVGRGPAWSRASASQAWSLVAVFLAWTKASGFRGEVPASEFPVFGFRVWLPRAERFPDGHFRYHYHCLVSSLTVSKFPAGIFPERRFQDAHFHPGFLVLTFLAALFPDGLQQACRFYQTEGSLSLAVGTFGFLLANNADPSLADEGLE